MPNAPSQFPQFDLPGAEYFALAPNSQIAISGRRRFRFSSTPVAIPISTNQTLTLFGQIEQPFLDTQGVYVHKFDAFVAPQSAGLTIVAALGGLNRRDASTGAQSFADYPLGYSALTTLQLPIATVALTDRAHFVAGRDIGAQITAPGFVTPILNVAFQANVSNGTGGAVTVSLIIQIVYTKLEGLLE